MIKQPKPSPFQLVNQRVVNVVFSLNEDATKNETNLEVEIGVKRSSKEKKALVELTININKGDTDQTLNLSVKNQGVFCWDERISDDAIRPYLEENAPALLLSYIRSLITNLTLAAGLPPMVFPLLNFRAE